MLKRLLKAGVGRSGYEIVNTRKRNQDMHRDPVWASVRALCGPYAMWTVEMLHALYECVAYVVDRRVQGDLAECGVWKGGGAMAIGETLFLKGDTSRDLYLYDLFGQPDRDGESFWAPVGRATVEANIARCQYPPDRFKLTQGDLRDTLEESLPERLALLRLDVQGYEPTRKALDRLAARLSPGGVILQMDYGTHPESAGRALDEYLERTGWAGYLHRAPEGGRIAVMGR